MARKVTPAQFKSAVQKAQRDHKRAVDDYNRKAKQHNAAVDKARRDQKRAIDNYNREARSYNSKARAHNQKRWRNQRRRLNQELQRQQRTNRIRNVLLRANVYRYVCLGLTR